MSEPITTALRGLLCAKPKGDPCWDAMDAIDAVHSALEAENAALRQRVEELDNADDNMHIGGATVTITPTLDWTGVARELRAIADTLAGDAS